MHYKEAEYPLQCKKSTWVWHFFLICHEVSITETKRNKCKKIKKVENLVPTFQSYINMEMKYMYALCFTDATSESKNGGVKSNFFKLENLFF